MSRKVCPSPTIAGRGERIAWYLDLENLVYGAGGDPMVAFTVLLGRLRRLAARGVLVAAIACCDCMLARDLAFAIADAGVRVFTHDGGPDAADSALIERIRHDLPSSVQTVVIGSGDHAFAPVAQELRERGLRVEVLARAGSISADLYRAAHDSHLIELEPA